MRYTETSCHTRQTRLRAATLLGFQFALFASAATGKIRDAENDAEDDKNHVE